jgi:hypothetical protein
MWVAPAFVAFFGDAFVEKTTFEASSNLPWSFTVFNHVLQRLLVQKLLTNDQFGLSHNARTGLCDTLHILQQSELVFKAYMKMLQAPSEAQLISFLKKLKKFLQGLSVGDSLLLPLYIEGRELMMFLERINERNYRAVVIQTDVEKGLFHHPVNSADTFPRVAYRTCIVLDDVFWMSLYNMAINVHDNDTARFYDVLIPFLTGKPLEASLVEVEKACMEYEENTSHVSSSESSFENCVSWRFPQRSRTAYVRCIMESLHYILLRRGLKVEEAAQVLSLSSTAPHAAVETLLDPSSSSSSSSS